MAGVSQHTLQVVSQQALQQVSRGIPACLAAGLRGGLSQHALQQVSGGFIPACLAAGLRGGFIPACLAAGLRGVYPSMPCRSPGPHLRGCMFKGVPAPRGTCSGGYLLHGGFAPWEVCSQVGVETPPIMATAAGGTHPAGMHSCYQLSLHKNAIRMLLLSAMQPNVTRLHEGRMPDGDDMNSSIILHSPLWTKYTKRQRQESIVYMVMLGNGSKTDFQSSQCIPIEAASVATGARCVYTLKL